MENPITKLIQSLKKNNLFLINKNIGVAVSGGVDSMVLLHVLCEVKKTLPFLLYVLHYNHKWRKESFIDTNLVKKYCKENSLPFIYAESKGKIKKTEEEAREKRISFFKDSTKKYNLDFICTAHHMDDQVETILFRLVRGTGPNGFLPIKEYAEIDKNLNLYRPLLNIKKKEIFTYAKKKHILFVEDNTNKDIKYKRNLIRNKIIPLFLEINKNAANNILDFSLLVSGYNMAADSYFSDIVKNIPNNPCSFNKQKFLKLNKLLQGAFIYWYLNKLQLPGSVAKINLIIESIKKNKPLDLTKKNKLEISGDSVSFSEKTTKKDKLKNNSITIKPYTEKAFNNKYPSDKSNIAYVDLSKFKQKKLIVRNRKPKDVFNPLGFEKNIKLKKYLINKKVPKNLRDSLPLLCMNNEVLWLPGYSLSENIKVKNIPTHILMCK